MDTDTANPWEAVVSNPGVEHGLSMRPDRIACETTVVEYGGEVAATIRSSDTEWIRTDTIEQRGEWR